MLDTSVVITLEVILQISFCLLSVHLLSSGKLKASTVWGYRILRWFPGVLIFGVLFSFLVYLIFAFPGVSFPLVAWSAAAVQCPDRDSGGDSHRQRTDGRGRGERGGLEGSCRGAGTYCRRGAGRLLCEDGPAFPEIFKNEQ